MRNLVSGLGLATAAALIATAAPAAAQGRQAAERPRAEANEQDRMICMRVQQGGSRITRRVCRTQSEWEARGELANDPR